MKTFKVGLIVILSICAVGLTTALIFLLNGRSLDNTFWSREYSLQDCREINVTSVSELIVDYDNTGYDIEIAVTEDDVILLEEYFTFEAEPEEFAVISSKGNRLQIRSGRDRRGFGIGNLFSNGSFSIGGYRDGYVRVCIPVRLFDELEKLDITGSSGEIEAPFLKAKQASVSTSSGNITIGDSTGDLSVGTSSGDIEIEHHVGSLALSSSSGEKTVKYCEGELYSSSSSGDTEIQSLAGEARISASSGRIILNVTELSGDIALQGSSGGARLTLPEDAQFAFAARTSSGRIDTAFDNLLSYNKKGNSAEGTVGANPLYDVRCDFSSGNVKVTVQPDD